MKWSVILLTTALGVALAEPNETQCYDDETNHYWDVNTEYRPIGRCVIVNCEKGGKDMAVWEQIGCSLYIPQPGCYFGDYDLTKPAPFCCPPYICEDKE